MSATEQKQASVGLHKYLSILVNAVLWVAVAASFFLFFGIATNVFFDLGPAGFHNLVAKTAKPLIHNERIAAALLLFLILTAIRRFLAHRRQVPPRSAFWLVVPLMLTTVWFPTGQMFPFMFVLTILVFVWSELIRQWPLPPDGDTTFPRSGWIQIGIGLAMAVWIVATAAASDSAAGFSARAGLLVADCRSGHDAGGGGLAQNNNTLGRPRFDRRAAWFRRLSPGDVAG